MRFLRVLIGALLLIILIVFAVANRQAISVSLEPLPFLLELPLYLLVFLVFFVGLVLGVIVGRWNAWSAARRKAQQQAAQRRKQESAPPKPAEPAAGPLPPAPMA